MLLRLACWHCPMRNRALLTSECMWNRAISHCASISSRFAAAMAPRRSRAVPAVASSSKKGDEEPKPATIATERPTKRARQQGGGQPAAADSAAAPAELPANGAPSYWLMKSEPDVFSIDDLADKPEQTEHWDGACAPGGGPGHRAAVRVKGCHWQVHSHAQHQTSPGVACKPVASLPACSRPRPDGCH